MCEPIKALKRNQMVLGVLCVMCKLLGLSNFSVTYLLSAALASSHVFIN